MALLSSFLAAGEGKGSQEEGRGDSSSCNTAASTVKASNTTGTQASSPQSVVPVPSSFDWLLVNTNDDERNAAEIVKNMLDLLLDILCNVSVELLRQIAIQQVGDRVIDGEGAEAILAQMLTLQLTQEQRQEFRTALATLMRSDEMGNLVEWIVSSLRPSLSDYFSRTSRNSGGGSSLERRTDTETRSGTTASSALLGISVLDAEAHRADTAETTGDSAQDVVGVAQCESHAGEEPSSSRLGQNTTEDGVSDLAGQANGGGVSPSSSGQATMENPPADDPSVVDGTRNELSNAGNGTIGEDTTGDGSRGNSMNADASSAKCTSTSCCAIM